LSSEEFRESAALYAVGALDPLSARRFETYLHTATSAEWREFRELTETAALLPLALPQALPSTQLKQRVLADFARTKHSNVVFLTRPTGGISPASRRLLIAASVVLAFGSVLLYWQNRQLAAQLAAARQQRETMISPTTRVIALTGDAAPQASARLLWDTVQQQWIIYIHNLPELPADKDYQLWYLTSDQNKVSAAVFRTDAQGRGELRLSVPPSITNQLAATAVTLEPRGGSPQPTGQTFLKGTI